MKKQPAKMTVTKKKPVAKKKVAAKKAPAKPVEKVLITETASTPPSHEVLNAVSKTKPDLSTPEAREQFRKDLLEKMVKITGFADRLASVPATIPLKVLYDDQPTAPSVVVESKPSHQKYLDLIARYKEAARNSEDEVSNAILALRSSVICLALIFA